MTTNQDQFWAIQQNIIFELAEKEDCVIVGRCADYILREKGNCLKILIHASMEKRAERIVREYGEREQSPEQRPKDKDKRRAAYYRFYTEATVYQGGFRGIKRAGLNDALIYSTTP